MLKYISLLKKSQLFKGVSEQEISSMLHCLGARLGTYKKSEYIFRQGDKLQYITLLLEGSLHIQKDDYWGNRSIINHVSVGEMFGEAYANSGKTALNDVVAIEDSTVIFFDVQRLLTTCSSACRFHSLVIENLFLAISEKNRKLMEKLGHISKRSTREKLLSYLSEEAKKQKSGNIIIPFNRQQLADFLSVDRSAMSNELSKLRDEGLIKFEKNKFELLL